MDRPTLAVFKFASCDGCQLSLLDCEDELLAITELVDIVNFPEASRRKLPGPYDIVLVEGSVTTAHDRTRIQEVRAAAKNLICIGACATSGGIQALRNFADVDEYVRQVYPSPEYISTLNDSTAIADHVNVDYELHGCPIDKKQLLEVVLAFASGRRPQILRESVCMECKARHNVCVMVAHGVPCLGPVTQAGCGALCPTYNRGCFGCYGLKEQAQPDALVNWLKDECGMTEPELRRSLRTYNAGAPGLDIIARESSGSG